jgi:hypothetical protein
MIRFLFEREAPEDPTCWHRWRVFFPVKTATGWTNGIVFRRGTDAGWECQPRKPDRIEWPREAR